MMLFSKSNWPETRKEEKRKDIRMSILCIGIVLNHRDLESKKYSFFYKEGEASLLVLLLYKRATL